MTKTLGRDELLSGEILKRELYEIPGTDTAVWMRELTTEHMLEFRRITDQFRADGVKNTTPEQDVEIMTAVISFSVCDESGNLLFSSPEEAAGLVKNNFNVLMDLGKKALSLSKVGTGEVAVNLPKEKMTSSSGSFAANSRKRGRKS